MRISPNPTIVRFTITHSSPLQGWVMYNAMGQIVPMAITSTAGQTFGDVRHLRPGLYFLQAATPFGSIVRTRMVVQ
jgi:hypothetical protein